MQKKFDPRDLRKVFKTQNVQLARLAEGSPVAVFTPEVYITFVGHVVRACLNREKLQFDACRALFARKVEKGLKFRKLFC